MELGHNSESTDSKGDETTPADEVEGDYHVLRPCKLCGDPERYSNSDDLWTMSDFESSDKGGA